MSALTPAVEFEYNPRVRELFADLSHAGVLSAANISVSAGAREQGAVVQLFLHTTSSHVQAVRYKAYGCPHLLAACESLALWLEGRPLTELSRWSWRSVETELAVPANKRSRLLTLDDVLRAAVARLG